MSRTGLSALQLEDLALNPGILAEFEFELETPDTIDRPDWPDAVEEDDEEADPAE